MLTKHPVTQAVGMYDLLFKSARRGWQRRSRPSGAWFRIVPPRPAELLVFEE
ncbi:MAG: hypothetical protein U9R53_10255 [Chloroflexota bacterium]|nr:hypothetical protein [Chloroflexota bacterium]